MKLELILYEFKVMNHEGVEGLSLNFLAIQEIKMGFATLQAVEAHFQHLEGLQFVAWEDNFVMLFS